VNGAAAIGPRISGAARRLPVWPVYLAGAVPGAWIVGDALRSVDPVEALSHGFGLLGLQLLLASLCITPLLRFGRINLVKFRKALGLLSFGYVTLHFAVWLFLDLQLRWGLIGAEIVKRPYLTVGFAGFLLLLPLAATSYAGAVRRMGAVAWARLHRLVYAAALLGGMHFVMQEKVWTTQSMTYLATGASLVAMRFAWIRRW
jgi:sulfoxide reductase heme-binding subunit YedZ